MNTYRNFVLAVLSGIAVLTAALPVTGMRQPMRADIPFDFYVAGKLLPAGTYTVAVSNFGGAVDVSDRRRNSAFALASSRVHLPANQGKSRLLFKKYGDTSILSGVSWTDSDDTLVLPTSAVEELIARRGGATKSVAVSRK